MKCILSDKIIFILYYCHDKFLWKPLWSMSALVAIKQWLNYLSAILKENPKSRCFWRILVLSFGQKLLTKDREFLLEVKSSTSREYSRFAYSNSKRETFAQGSRKRQRMMERGGGSMERNEATLGTRGVYLHARHGKMFAEQFLPPLIRDRTSNSPSWLATEYERSR